MLSVLKISKLHMHCCCSVAKSCLTVCVHMGCSMPGFLSFTLSQSLLKFMSVGLVMHMHYISQKITYQNKTKQGSSSKELE